MRTLFLSLTTLIVSGFLSSTMAFKVAEPKQEEFKSPNGTYVLKVNPKTKEHQLCEGQKVLWTFKQEVWHDDFFVSNDGQHVLSVSWRFVQEANTEKGEAVVVHSAKGKVISKTYRQVSKPEGYQNVRPGPVGDFWRIWREEVQRDGEKVTIEVTGKEPLVVDLANPVGD